MVIVNQLTSEELILLGVLEDNDATATFKAIKRKDMESQSELKSWSFRKALSNLREKALIDIVGREKEHRFYLNEFGMRALQISLEGVE